MKSLISLLFVLFILNSCYQKNKDVERYNEAKHKELGTSLGLSIFYMRGDTGVTQMGLTKREGGGGYYEEYPPGPSYYMIRKDFYPNGMLESKGMYAGEGTKIGIWYYYDDRGNLTSEVDEDAKFGPIKLDWIIEFLRKEGYDSWERYNSHSSILRLNFWPKGEEAEYPVWYVTVYKDMMIYYYHIHGDTGEVTEKGGEANTSFDD